VGGYTSTRSLSLSGRANLKLRGGRRLTAKDGTVEQKRVGAGHYCAMYPASAALLGSLGSN
jgi:hypothetical protein